MADWKKTSIRESQTTYDRLKEFCHQKKLSMSKVREIAIKALLDGEIDVSSKIKNA